MRTSVVAVVILLTALPLGWALGEPVERAPLDHLWNDAMLEGRSLMYTDLLYKGRTVSTNPFHGSYKEAFGSPYGASLKAEGISVEDLTETRFGLWRGGGWLLDGGPLEKIDAGTFTLELYGKQVLRRAPIFILNVRKLLSHAQLDTLVEYQFFLLLRRPDTKRAELIQKWSVPRGEVMLTNGDETAAVSGALSYDQKTKTATVEIRGLKTPLQRSVNLSNHAPR